MDMDKRDFGEPFLLDYHMDISRCFRHEQVIPILIKKIREASSEDEAMMVWDKYREWPFASRFIFYDREDKITTIKKEMEVLDYFGIEYPEPPEGI
ncbi:MAG: hypothetical protein ACD_15C00211G0003 [uncultured bacterium]|nr:MAG: hypothetical protein ACD_15C00211G0003 [uncultured bacterium]